MGQYLKGEKIGTCECMYYLKLSEAQEFAKEGMADDDGERFGDYLKDKSTRFRFAWPDEDGETFEHNKGREPFKTFVLPCPVEINHGRITVHNTHEGGGYGINIFIPCPHSKEFHLEMSTGGAGEQFVSVKFQAIRDGQEKTIFACARCGQQQRFTDDEVEKIKVRATEYYSVYKRKNEDAYSRGGNKSLYEYAMKVIERIR